MGYMCLSVLETSAGGRQAVGNLYDVDVKVLRTLGHLTSKIGDRQTARKAPASGGTFRPHTDSERAWVEAAIQKVILRVGQYAADPNKSLPKLTMDDLPKLT